jgi:hypothetical protein
MNETIEPSKNAGPHLELPADLEPVYSNLVRISHSPAELVFDFACMLPDQLSTRVLARLLLSPIGAKLFLRAFGENLARYEAAFGQINLPGEPSLATDLFGFIQPPEKPPEG